MRTAAEIIAQRFGPYYPDVDLGAILQDTTNVFKKENQRRASVATAELSVG